MQQLNWLVNEVHQGLVEQILHNLRGATDLSYNLINPAGEVVIASGQKCLGYCEVLNRDPAGSNRCRLTYVKAGRQAARFGEPYFFRCWAGLVNWAAPVQVEGEYLGAIFCGRVLMREPRDYFWSELKRLTEGTGVDLEELKKAALELPIVNGAKIQAIAELLWLLGNYITGSEMKNLEYQKEIKRREAQLALEIQSRKLLEQKLDLFTGQAMLQKHRLQEEKLIKYFRSGNLDKASAVLEEVIAELFLKSGGDLTQLKGYAVELSVILSRTAVEKGAKQEGILEINAGIQKQLDSLTTPDAIHSWLRELLTVLEKQIKSEDGQKSSQVVLEVINYLKDNYRQPLTLKDIAAQVYLSPAHLGAIFKKEVGCTVMEFLTGIRLEQAQKLLRRREYNVVQVAKATGYFDPSYFTKVFKRELGISPSEYKRKFFPKTLKDNI